MAKKPKNPLDDDPEIKAWVDGHNRWYDSLTMDQKIAYHRTSGLRILLKWRKIMKMSHPDSADFWREKIRESQIDLVKLRTWRSTGIEPGHG
jgi:hypothetical protein